MVSKFNFSVYLGVDDSIEVTYAPNDVEFNLTGWVVKCQLRRTKLDTAVALELSTDNNKIIVNQAVCLLSFLAADIAALTGVYEYDLLATNGSGKRIICEGKISINPTATRPLP